MATTSTTYVPYDPMRICDVCGDLQRKSQMRRLPGNVWACSNEPGWRSAVELDRANARQRPFRIRPVKDAKPEAWSSPDSYEGDEGEILNFLARAITSGARYENVTNGDRAASGAAVLQTYGWTAQYLYGLIVENKRPGKWISQAKTTMDTIATTLRTRQYGGGLTPFTDAFTGAFLESGASTLVSDDCASCGLAMLYAYRVLGTPTYLLAARQAASYLRNVQAIGSHGANYTSSDAAGTARLYTGAVASEVSTAFGVDPNDVFYANHLFYPSGLLTIRLWKELQTTNGDQAIGATTAVNGFSTAPAQMLSQCLLDMRSFWANGTRDAAGETYTGLSATTPRECFNAYPLAKKHFTAAGAARWEYANGTADVGTQITSQNFATALSALYFYEGASTQVTGISDWLRTFTSNTAFETPANQSISQLARTTTGEFVSTDAPTTLLTVRDAADAYAAIKTNGSSLYDWGAFGQLSTVWGSRNLSSFIEARKVPLGRNQRYYDGQRSDGDQFDCITLRGKSGLSLQTAFSESTTTFGSFSSIATEPESVGLGFWFQSNLGITKDGSNVVSRMADQTGNGWDLYTPQGINEGQSPTWVADRLDGLPAIFFDHNDDKLAHYGGPYNEVRQLVYPTGTPYGPFAESEPNTVIAVIRPDSSTGGMVFADRLYFSRQLWVFGGDPLKQRLARTSGGVANSILYTPAVDYTNDLMVVIYRWDGANMYISVNGAALATYDYFTTNPSAALSPVMDAQAERRMYLGASADDLVGFRGDVFAVFGYTGVNVPARTISYIAGVYGSATSAMTNDAVRAAQFATSFRIAPVEPQQVF